MTRWWCTPLYSTPATQANAEHSIRENIMANLTDDQLAQLKDALQQRYLELREEIRSELEQSGNQHYADLAGSVADPGDASVADLLVEQSHSLSHL